MEDGKKKRIPEPGPDRPTQSGRRSRHRGPDDGLAAATSQLRRRFDADVELELRRARETLKAEPAGDNEPASARQRHISTVRRDVVASEAPGWDASPTPLPRLAMSCIPRRTMRDAQLLALPLDHRAGFILAHIDGETTIRTLLDVCSMSHEEFAEVIERLIAFRVIVLSY